MMVTFEPLRTLHRPLFWYIFFIGSVDVISWCLLKWHGFQHFRLPVSQTFTSFPFRVHTLPSSDASTAPDTPYWYRPHRSTTKLPILFIHAIGVGIFTYVDFFTQHMTEDPTVGIIALEILPVSSRMCLNPVPTAAQTIDNILKIFHCHNWTQAILVTHSYGSVPAAHLLKSPQTFSLIAHTIFIDPVCFSFHTPNVAYNFLRRTPQTASEIELHYFACTDPDIVRALTRSFIWPENSLWREDVEDRKHVETNSHRRHTPQAQQNEKHDQRQHHLKTTVILSGRDIVTDTLTLGRYLTRHQNLDHKPNIPWYREDRPDQDEDRWKLAQWKGDKSLEVVWLADLNHAEAFDDDYHRKLMVGIMNTYAADW